MWAYFSNYNVIWWVWRFSNLEYQVFKLLWLFKGMQTPLEPGTEQKPVEHHTQNPASIKVNEPVHRQSENSTKGSIMEKFRGNEQYKRPYDIPVQPSADSVKVSERLLLFFVFLPYVYRCISKVQFCSWEKAPQFLFRLKALF